MHPLRYRLRRAAGLACVLLVAFVVASCARPDQDETAGDTAGAPAPAPSAGADTGMGAMKHANMPGMAGAQDADQEFLGMMVDHHEGLIVMMDESMERASAASAKADAKRLHDKQHDSRDRMLGILRSAYNDSHEASVMPSDKAMNDSLQRQSGAAYDRDMYRHIVMHHREGVRMVDDFLPRLKRADVRQMAERMRAEQTREISEFERKQGGRS
jgi:uncharacterized protein (DUF305 family)